MAVNKITNKGVVNRVLVNRANEVSTKGTTIRGDRETTIIPGNTKPKSILSATLISRCLSI